MIDPNIALSYRSPQVPDPLAVQTQQSNLKTMANQQQLQQAALTGENQQNQQRQMDIEDQQKMRQVFATWDGKNPDDLMRSVQQAGVQPKTVLGLQQNLLDLKTKYATLDKDTRANLLAKNTAMQSALTPVAQEQDPAKQAQSWNQASQNLVSNGTMTAQEAAQHPYPGSPDAVLSYVKGLNADKWALMQEQQSKANESNTTATKNKAELPGIQAKSDQEVLQNATSQVAAAKPKDGAAYQQFLDNLPHKVATQMLATVPVSDYDPKSSIAALQYAGMTPDQQRMTDLRAQEIAKLTSEAELSQKAAQGDPVAKRALDLLAETRRASQPQINITPGGYAVLGQQYQTTGQLPTFGRGPAGQVQANVVNQAATNTPGFNPGAVKSDYKADTGSLANLQKQSDALDAYGAKFIANLNQFKKVAAELPNAGSQYLNMPIRMLDEKLLGRDIYGQFNVARTVAANEGGRILTGGANLGGVVSDSARGEIEHLLDKNATLGQWLAAVDQLNTDYNNTKTAMAGQLKTVRGRIANNGQQQTQEPAAPAPAVDPHTAALRKKYNY